jgi:two-component system cell cycle sensor histidine kinase/response regulator CckA
MSEKPTYEELEQRIRALEKAAAEHERIEQALKQSEERYRLLAENVTDVIWVMDENLKFTYISPSIERLSGFTPEEAIEQGSSVHLTPASLEFANKVFEEHFKVFMESPDTAPEPLKVELEDVRKDGSTGWSELNTTLLRSPEGEFAGFVGVSRDISKRKQAEEELKRYRDHLEELVAKRTVELRKSNEELQLEIAERGRAEAALREGEERLELALRGGDLGLWDWNVVTGELVVNQRCAEMVGYTLDEIGPHIRWYEETLLPDEKPGILEKMTAHLRGKTPLFEAEHRLPTKSGDWIWVLSRGRVVERAEDGKALRVTGTNLDITRRKQAEEQRARLETELRQSQKMDAIGRLAGGISHDINNLLTAISVSVDLMLMDIAENDPLSRECDEIKKAVEQATSMTNHLLAFSSKQMLEPKVLDLNQVVRRMQGMLRRLIGEHIVLEALLDRDTGQVRADSGQLEQVLMNLALNARDAMPRGGKLTIKTAEVTLGQEYAREHIDAEPGPYVMLAVSDTGHGMDEETQSHIFEPFFTTKEAGRGTGLGLSTVFGVVKQSKGRISVSSEPGRGATLTIYLPSVPDRPEAEEARQARPETLRGTETVLLVEDEQMVRRAVRDVLQRNGYSVLVASNAGEALLISEQHTGFIHLLVTDVVMPRMSGPDLVERLNPWHPEMKVLYVSGYTDNAIAEHGVPDPGVALLQKPFSVESLLQKVKQVLTTPKVPKP